MVNTITLISIQFDIDFPSGQLILIMGNYLNIKEKKGFDIIKNAIQQYSTQAKRRKSNNCHTNHIDCNEA